jgi:hypothetical protein
LKIALTTIQAGKIGINEAACYYGNSPRILRRRRQTDVLRALPFGPQGVLGTDNEKMAAKNHSEIKKIWFRLRP